LRIPYTLQIRDNKLVFETDVFSYPTDDGRTKETFDFIMQLKSEHPSLIENTHQELQDFKKIILQKEKKQVIRDFSQLDMASLMKSVKLK
jgi:hypothetical protein